MTDDAISDYRFPQSTRKNNPTAGQAPEGKVKEAPKVIYDYNPHLPPVLSFDSTGKTDALPELLAKARTSPLSDEDIQTLAAALKNHQPWLQWAGKQEAEKREVDPVALHIHERVSSQAILRIAARQDVTRSLFADPEQEYREAVQFYQHDVDWANRLILGDSLQVMASLAQREDLAGKVQCIYMDPPYGIKYASNFQSEVGKRDVKDKPEDLTREPEMVKAYRDTWTLGVHSYLTYLRDRLAAAKELLTDSGSVFVQISEENVHRVRAVMDEVFGPTNHYAQISFVTTPGLGSSGLKRPVDFLLWYAKDATQMKYRSVYLAKTSGEGVGGNYNQVLLHDGEKKSLLAEERDKPVLMSSGSRLFLRDNLTSGAYRINTTIDYWYRGRRYHPGNTRCWKTTKDGLDRLASAERIEATNNSLSYVRFIDDFPVTDLSTLWVDTSSSFMPDKCYVVQTNTKVIERCLLMTTDPGDLVLDPTCGSGTTAVVAEQWGRRWITMDTSRVALTIARQRLLTSKFDYYALRAITAEDTKRNPNGIWLSDPQKLLPGCCTFDCKTVPHVTLGSIAQNPALDPIFAQWEPILDDKLMALNAALGSVTLEMRQALLVKLELKKRKRDKSDPVTDADTRRWQLPMIEAGWQHWQVPFDTDPGWPLALQEALTEYRKSWRAKMDAVNATIAARADQEELVDQPRVEKGKLRVCGPFTVEGVRPGEESLNVDGPIDTLDERLETFGGGEPEDELKAVPPKVANAEAYLDRMTRLMKSDGVRFPQNKVVQFDSLAPLQGHEPLYAEGIWCINDEERRVAVAFGPEYGPITADMVGKCIRRANRRGYDDLVFAGFSFDGMAQAAIEDDSADELRCYMAHIRPDEMMGDLLKETPNAQLFTVSGLPRVELKSTSSGEFTVEMQGVDIYDPVRDTIVSANAGQVAAWFLDSDYDGSCFCITQAFFPDPKAWEKLAKALSGVVDADRFAALSGTTSLPFPAGRHKKAAVKVIDPRGNEVMRLLDLREGGTRYAA